MVERRAYPCQTARTPLIRCRGTSPRSAVAGREPFETGQQLFRFVLGLTTDVLQPSAQVAGAISPDDVQRRPGNVQVLRDSAPSWTRYQRRDTTRCDASAISDPKFLSAIRGARTELQAQTSDITGLLKNAALAARLAPR